MGADSKGLVILLHGVGSNGADMAGLADAMAPALPGIAFATPDGPLPFDGGGMGRQWFSIAGVTTQNRPARVAAARAARDEMLAGLIAEAGFADRLDTVILLGFSQGSIMALDAMASGRWALGGVVAFAGRLATPTPLAPALKTPVLIIHGDADRVMPVAEAGDAEARLTALGAKVEVLIEPGIGHQVGREGLSRAVAFTRERLLRS
jgi:phospholipase/carboxylesterase